MKRYVVSLTKRDKMADYSRFQQFIEGNVSFAFGEDTHVIILKSQASLEQLFHALKEVVQPDDKLFIAEVLDWRSHPGQSGASDANA